MTRQRRAGGNVLSNLDIPARSLPRFFKRSANGQYLWNPSSSEQTEMKEDRFIPPPGAFTRTVPIRFSHCDPAGIVYFPHYFDMFNGLVEDWYTEQLGVNYANLILGDQHGFPYVHIETDFKLPSRMGERLDLTLLLTRVGRSSLSVVIVGHVDGVERLRARLVTAMTSLETHQSVELPQALRGKFEAYMKATGQT